MVACILLWYVHLIHAQEETATPLFLAVQTNNVMFAAWLISNGADLDFKDEVVSRTCLCLGREHTIPANVSCTVGQHNVSMTNHISRDVSANNNTT